MNKRLIIGFGTGRCGTKSLAAFLDQQTDISCGHEELIPWDPQHNAYFSAIDLMIRDKTESIVGNISAAWVNYIDRIVVDFPTAKLILLIRDIDAVVDSFHSYMKRQLGRRTGLLGMYPILEWTYSKEAVDRSVKRYLYKQSVLLDRYSSILRIHVDDLGTEKWQKAILDHIGISRGAQILGMPHLNKRGEMS